MKVLGLSKLGRRAQKVVRDDPRCANLLGIENNGALDIYHLVTPHGQAEWSSYYSLMARISPADSVRDSYLLMHLSLSNQWQEIDVEGSLEYCVCHMMGNSYHLFFG